MSAPPVKLQGKTAWFWLDGLRSGRIVRIDQGPRTGLRSVVVRLAGMREDGKLGHYGPRKRLSPRAFRAPPAGVLYRGRLVPLERAMAPLFCFALVELVIAIAILTVLLCVLLPALAAARARGRDAACLAQLHQLALAYGDYAGVFRMYPASPAQLRAYADDSLIWTCPGDPWRGALYRALAPGVVIDGPPYSQQSWSNTVDARDTVLIADPFALRSDCVSYHGRWINAGYTDGRAARMAR